MEVTRVQDGPLTSLTRRHLDLGDSTGRRALLVPDLLSLLRFLGSGHRSARSGNLIAGIVSSGIDHCFTSHGWLEL
jgi:hypothetical protein